MTFNPDIHHRKSIRLRGYDYAQAGMYFVTVCCHERQALLGEIAHGEMVLSSAGRVVEESWAWLSKQYEQVRLNERVIMPNHVHAIIEIVGAQFIAPSPANQDENQGAMIQGAMNRAPTVGGIVRAFKGRSTHAVNQLRQLAGLPVWQRNYYEHIIRDEAAYLKIAKYIQTNPQHWCEDTYHV